MTQKIVAGAVSARYQTGNTAAQAVIAVPKDGETGRGFVVEWAARNQLKAPLVANNSGFVELTGLPERFQSRMHASGASLERE